MKIKFLTTLVLLIFFFSFSSCKKIDTTEEVPNCIKRKIRKESRKSNLVGVSSFNYNNEKVYYFSFHTLTGYHYILDKNCNKLCSSNQGPTACNEIVEEATDGKLVWQN